MNQKFLLAWATVATVLASVLLGYAIGRSGAADGGATAVPPAHGADAATATEAGAGAQPVPAESYVVPDALAALPAEWRTPFEGGYTGYAILLDFDRRELIVERCRHRGYFDARLGVPIEADWSFCDNVIWSTLVRIDETGATAVGRERGAVEVSLDLDREAKPLRLRLSFDDHDMRLVPGSKNDLFQAMDRSPRIQAQRERAARVRSAEDAARRRLMEEGVVPGVEPVPVYSLPETGSPDTEERGR